MAKPELSEFDAAGLALHIWHGFFGVHLGITAPAETDADRICSRVAISGAWDGALFVCCDRPLALRAAASTFGTDRPSKIDVEDVVGEFANMIAGSLGRYLPDGTRAALPVIEDVGRCVPAANDDVALEVDLEGRHGIPCRITLLRRQRVESPLPSAAGVA